MNRIRRGGRRQQVGSARRIRSLTANAGLAAITELCDRLGVIGALDAAVGPIKQRDRGFGAGELLAGLAAAQLAGEDFLTGLDRQRADAAASSSRRCRGWRPRPRPGLARRITPAQWRAVESGLAAVTGRCCRCCPRRGRRPWPMGRSPSTWTPPTWRSTAARSAAWPITTRASGSAGRTWPPGRRPRPCWPPTWATAPMTRARPRRTCCAARWPPCPRRRGPGRVAMRADAGYFAGGWPAPPTTRTSLRDRRQADRAAVAAAGRDRRGGLARCDRDGQCPGRRG